MKDHRVCRRRLVEATTNGSLDALCTRHAVAVLGAHGSAVTGDRPACDLDVAVPFRGPSDIDVLLSLSQGLSDLAGGAEIDVIDLSRVDPVARTHGLSGPPLFEDRPGRFAEVTIAALSERLDTAWLRRLEREVLAG